MLVKRELTIQEEQKIQFDILKHFSQICEKEQLRYFLAYGTLLGACRSSGFIPWDDDVDIWMPRKDYERFLEVYPKFQKEEYFLQTSKTDPYYLKPVMARICVNNTCKFSDKWDALKFHKGIFFDIFPLDYGFGDFRDDYYLFITDVYLYTLAEKALKDAGPQKSVQTEQAGPQSPVKAKPVWLQRLARLRHMSLREFVKKVMFRVLYYTSSTDELKRKIERIVKKYASHTQSGITISLPCVAHGKRGSYYNSAFFDKEEYLPFEGATFPCPQNYQALLTYIYGDDYMTPKIIKHGYEKAFVIETN